MEIVNFIPQTTIINIDNYFMIVIGLITIYGIMLAFHQFVVSLYGNKASGLMYLYCNLSDYNLDQNVPLLKIAKNPFFKWVTIIEIIFAPFLIVAGYILPKIIMYIMSFAWYAWVIIYFCIFFIMFWQCASAMSRIRLRLYDKDELVKLINKDFVKTRNKVNKKKRPIDALDDDLRLIKRALESDGYPSKQPYYDLMFELISKYIQSKKTEINKMKNGNEIPENQEGWLYNERVERDIISNIINGSNDIEDESVRENIVERVFRIYKDLLKLNSKRAKLDGYEIISCERSKCTVINHAGIALKNFYTEPFVSRWKGLLVDIYNKASKDLKARIVEEIYNLQIKHPEWIYFKEYISKLARDELDAVFEEKESQVDYWYIFGLVVMSDTYRIWFSNMLAEKLVEYDRFDASDIIKMIDESTCSFLFFYIVIHYSIYRFRKNWQYINLKVLNSLWDRHSDLHKCHDEVVNRIKESDTGHRFYEGLYQRFLDYIEENNEFIALQKAKNDNAIDLFYIWLVRRMATRRRVYFLPDEDYVSTENTYIITLIFNELAGHEELLENDQIKEWIGQMRYFIFSKLQSIPKAFDISLESLLLTDINGKCVAAYIRDHEYCKSDVGTYLLIKSWDLLKVQHKDRDIIVLIFRAFIESNCDLDTYIQMITEKCRVYGVTLDYIQAEQIRYYLQSIIVDYHQQNR